MGGKDIHYKPHTNYKYKYKYNNNNHNRNSDRINNYYY